MTSFTFRAGAGVPGTISTTHPASVRPRLNDTTTPVATPGLACLYNGSSNDVRGMAPGDAGSTAISIAGVAVRAYPTQQPTSTQNWAQVAYGAYALPSGVVIDILEEGGILVPIVGTPNLGGTVYVWTTTATGSHVQGGFEASSTSGSTVPVANAYFEGGVDSTGVGVVVLRGNP